MIFSGIFIVAGIAGCILPALPGPPLSYVGLILLQFTSRPPFTTKFLIILATLTIIVTLLDYVIPVYGTKKLQGSKYGIWGSAIGLVIGLIFFPFPGIIIGPLLGAFLGELTTGKKIDKAIKSALGSFLGFITGTAVKLILSLVMAYHFIVNVF
ncbi:MAG: DUF456 domain-containing protein [Nitrospirae bacterium]|jgi:uncharacterized protein|nr:DUF456 domain-containing protein [Nitrospirota bacterium]